VNRATEAEETELMDLIRYCGRLVGTNFE